MVRRINLFAGPCAGKSTTASHLFYQMKCAGYNVEYAPEYVKTWTLYGRAPKSFDQVYLFARQLHNEDSILNGGFQYVICDSPLLLCYYYTTRYSAPCRQQLYEIAQEFEKLYPSVNIFIERSPSTYHTTGRFQTFEQALLIDKELKELFPNLHSFPYDQPEQTYRFLTSIIGEPHGKD